MRTWLRIKAEYERTVEIILKITEQEKLCTRFKKFGRKLTRRTGVLHQAGMEQVRLVKKFREKGEEGDQLEELVPLLLSINCISSGLGWTG